MMVILNLMKRNRLKWLQNYLRLDGNGLVFQKELNKGLLPSKAKKKKNVKK